MQFKQVNIFVSILFHAGIAVLYLIFSVVTCSNYKFNRRNRVLPEDSRTFYIWFSLCFKVFILCNLLSPSASCTFLREISLSFIAQTIFQWFHFDLILLNITLNILSWELCTVFSVVKSQILFLSLLLIFKPTKFKLFLSPLPMGFQITKLFISNIGHIEDESKISKNDFTCVTII